MNEHYLEHLFSPTSIAVIGASERPGSLGRIVFDNLRAAGFLGELLAVNPKYSSVAGLPCAPSIAVIGHRVDLMLVTTPASSVPAIIEEAGQAGVRSAVILSAGFGKSDVEGMALQQSLLVAARRHGMRLVGPNCLGIMRPSHHLNATFARRMALPGSIALVSQSGAVASALVDGAQTSGIGFSNVISMGAGIDLDIGEILDYLTYDYTTRSILIYLEGVRNARRFISGLRAAARAKPVIVLKGGGNCSGRRGAVAQGDSTCSDDAAFDAVLRRCGAVRVRTYAELFSTEQLIGVGRLPRSNCLAIVSNGSGPGAIAANRAAEAGVEIAQLSSQTMAALDACLPAHWSHGNPVDILGDASAERYRLAVASLLEDDGVAAVLTLFSPQQVLASDVAAQAIADCAQATIKPVLTAWLGDGDVRAGRSVAAQAKLSVFHSPESAVSAFATLAEYRMAQNLLLEVPAPLSSATPPNVALAFDIAHRLRDSGRTRLNGAELASLLGCFGIPYARTEIGRTAEEVRTIAKDIGFPVVIKLLSGDIEHLSDVRGVCLNIRNEQTLMNEYEALLARVSQMRPDAFLEGVTIQPMVEKRYGRHLMIGVNNQATFGRMIRFGAGGFLATAMQDDVVGLPPLNQQLAQELITRTRAAHLLQPYRHIPGVATDAVLDSLLRVSEMVCALPWLVDMEIDPLIADESGCIAVEARVGIDFGQLNPDPTYAHLAIHPYPKDLEHVAVLRDGQRLHLRPIRPEDATLILAFAESMSEHSYFMRFFSPGRGLSRAMLAQLTQVDYDRELALIALLEGDDKVEAMVGVARYAPNPDAESCEFAVSVADDWNGRGLASLLMRRLMQAARESGYVRMTGSILAENAAMLQLAKRLGFTRKPDVEDSAIALVVCSLS